MFKWKDRKYVNPRKKIFKNLDTNEILNLEVQDDEDNISEESDTPLTAHCLNMAQQELVDDMSKTYTGTNITAETVAGLGRVNKVYGFCRQETRSGINKFDLAKISHTSNFEVTQTGVKLKNCWVNGIYFAEDVLKTFKPNATYTMRAKAKVISRPSTIISKQLDLFALYRPASDSSPIFWRDCLKMPDKETVPLNQEKYYISTFTTPEDMTGISFVTYTFNGNNDGGTTGQSIGEIEVSEIMLVEGSYTEDNFPDYEPYGASPSPNFLAKTHCLGDDENLFDNKIQFKAAYVSANGTEVSGGNSKITVDYIKIDPSTDYILTCPGFEKIACYDSSKNFLKIIATSAFFNENASYIRVQVDSKRLDVNKIKLQEGTEATPYSPYGYGSVVNKSKNKNLASTEIIKSLNKPVFTDITSNGFALDVSQGIVSGLNLIDIMFRELDGSKQYTLSYHLSQNNTTFNPRLAFYYTDGTTSFPPINSNSEVDVSFSSVVGKTIERISLIWSTAATGSLAKFSKIQLEKGDKSDYVPHKEDTQTTYLKEPLYGIDDVRDELDLSNKKIIRRLGKKVFDGTETWHTGQDMGEVMRFYSSSLNLPKSVSFGMSNYFKWLKHYTDNSEHFYIGSDGYLYIFIDKKTCPDTASFKVWLSEHPVEIVYPLNEPIIEPIECSDKIKQFDGQTTIYNVDGAELECILTNNRAIAQINQNLQKIEEMISGLKAGG